MAKAKRATTRKTQKNDRNATGVIPARYDPEIDAPRAPKGLWNAVERRGLYYVEFTGSGRYAQMGYSIRDAREHFGSRVLAYRNPAMAVAVASVLNIATSIALVQTQPLRTITKHGSNKRKSIKRRKR
jgi:hypothetical protein